MNSKREKLYLEIESKSENESLARVIVSAFAARLDPTLEEVSDIKTAVSEAVTNSVIHGYEGNEGIIKIECEIEKNILFVNISDEGVGIADVKQAMQPLFSTKKDEERSGMGFSFMEIFMDELNVESESGKGTKIMMKKIIGGK
ncbi:anti-sigma F factor [Lachnospiraceae bacterium HCP1S3_C3]|nr:anti-sigma F factor [Lachnospiraceae bacterium]MDD6857144.1 anti-sigma F factor [Lachnospiraceae bacterium]